MTITVLQDEFPAASAARTTMVFMPVRSGIATVCQRPVPEAVPESPAAVDQVTALTPTLSEAIPLSTNVLAVVDNTEELGFVIVSEGAVRSGDAGSDF